MLQKENEGVEGGDNDIVFIPRMALDAPKDEFPVPLHHLQFPVRLHQQLDKKSGVLRSSEHLKKI